MILNSKYNCKKKNMFFAFLCFVLFFNSSQLSAQTSHFLNQLRFGGSVGLSFGDGFFSGTLAPSALYEINDFIGLGLGLNATYNTRKDVSRSTILGGSILGIVNPLDVLQLSAEFENVYVNTTFEDSAFENDKFWVTGLFLGAGLRSNNVTFGVRYDVLYDEDKSIYANAWLPFVRVYF